MAKTATKKHAKTTAASEATTAAPEKPVATKKKAKTKKPNKSVQIREALAATPDKPVAEIAKELKVTPALVYNVKANMKKKAGKPTGKKRGRKPGVKYATNGHAPHAAHADLDTAFDFVTKVGGLLHAEQLIGKLKAFKEKL